MKHKAQPIDIIIGAKIKERRKNMKMSQEALSKLIGVSQQQVQKYEDGGNRVSVSCLIDICSGLDMTASHFMRVIENEK